MSGIYAPEEWQADPKQVKRIGIVQGGHLFVIEHRDPRGVPLRIVDTYQPYSTDLAEVVGEAFGANCGALWILDEGRSLSFDADDPHYVWHPLSAKGAITGAVAQVRGDTGAGVGMPLGIYAPHVNDAWGIAGQLRGIAGRTLAEGVALAAFALGQQLRFSPSYTGIAMMRRVLADYEQDKDARLAAEDKRAGRDHETYTIPQLSPEWREKLLRQELRGGRMVYEMLPPPMQQRMNALAGCGDAITIHIYDRNMSYVSNAREVPVGDPVKTDTITPNRPGVYLVMNILAPEDAPVWMWEPELRHTVRPGDSAVYTVLDGYYWPREQKLDLRGWHDRVWAARRAARAVDSIAGKIAEKIIKKVGVSTVGRLIQGTGRAMVSEAQALRENLPILSYESDDAGELTGNVEVEVSIGKDDLVCPHWWGTIISGANERLWHAISKYAPHDTVLVYVDQFYCLQQHPELDGDPMKTGGWKHDGSFSVPVRDLDELNTLNAQQLVKRFARYQREQGMR